MKKHNVEVVFVANEEEVLQMKLDGTPKQLMAAVSTIIERIAIEADVDALVLIEELKFAQESFNKLQEEKAKHIEKMMFEIFGIKQEED